MQGLALGTTQSLPLAGPSWSLPFVDFLAVENRAFLEELLKIALPEDQKRLRAYLSKVYLGIAAVTGVSTYLTIDNL